MANSLFDLWGGGGYGNSGYGSGMPYNTLAGLGLGLMSGTVGDPYGPAMRGFAQGSQTDAAERYRAAQMRQHAEDKAQAQRNADRAFNFQKEQADLAARGYEYKTDPDSGQLIRIDKSTGRAATVPVEGAPSSPPNPYAYPGAKPMTEAQSKDALYATRMFGAEKVLTDPNVVAAGKDLTEQAKAKVPIVGNYLVGSNYQAYDQAARDFINAVLRRESGAVISQSEFDNAYKQYLPQPGDDERKLEQKRANREAAIKGIAAGAGKNYRPPYLLEERAGAFSPSGSKSKPSGTTKSGIQWSVD